MNLKVAIIVLPAVWCCCVVFWIVSLPGTKDTQAPVTPRHQEHPGTKDTQAPRTPARHQEHPGTLASKQAIDIYTHSPTPPPVHTPPPVRTPPVHAPLPVYALLHLCALLHLQAPPHLYTLLHLYAFPHLYTLLYTLLSKRPSQHHRPRHQDWCT